MVEYVYEIARKKKMCRGRGRRMDPMVERKKKSFFQRKKMRGTVERRSRGVAIERMKSMWHE